MREGTSDLVLQPRKDRLDDLLDALVVLGLLGDLGTQVGGKRKDTSDTWQGTNVDRSSAASRSEEQYNCNAPPNSFFQASRRSFAASFPRQARVISDRAPASHLPPLLAEAMRERIQFPNRQPAEHTKDSLFVEAGKDVSVNDKILNGGVEDVRELLLGEGGLSMRRQK